MEYKQGDKFYLIKKNGETAEFKIKNIVYTFEGLKTACKYMTEAQFEDFCASNNVVKDIEEVKRYKIRKLEEELGIRLKEV